jgi:hypothetical protein
LLISVVVCGCKLLLPFLKRLDPGAKNGYNLFLFFQRNVKNLARAHRMQLLSCHRWNRLLDTSCTDHYTYIHM